MRPRWVVAAFIAFQIAWPLTAHAVLAVTGVRLPGGWMMLSF